MYPPGNRPATHKYPMPTFREWLKSPEEAADAEKLATLIAGAGPAGVTLDGLRRVVRLSPETLEDLLRALTATGQVVMIRANGRLVYRAAG